MQKVVAARASSLDRVIPCASSALPTPVVIDRDHPLTRMGSAVHEACAAIVDGAPVDAALIAASHRVDVDELRMMTSVARRAWVELMPYIPDATSEYEFPPVPGLITHGTTDVLSRAWDGDVLVAMAVVDWKSGWLMTEHPNQLIGYAWRARYMHGMPERGYISGFEVWLRFDEWRPHRFTDDDLDAFEARLRLQLGRAGEQYAPGDHCTFCPHALTCGPREDWLRSGVGAMVPVEPGVIVTREMVALAWDKWQQIKNAGAIIEQAADSLLLDGDIEIEGGRRLTVRPEERKTIDPVIALEVLAAEFGIGNAALAGSGGLKIRNGGLRAAVMDITPKGKKKKEADRAIEVIDQRGGVDTKTIRRKVIIHNETKGI